MLAILDRMPTGTSVIDAVRLAVQSNGSGVVRRKAAIHDGKLLFKKRKRDGNGWLKCKDQSIVTSNLATP